MVALFEGRTTIGTIDQWRYGRRSPPQWAVDILRRRAAEIAKRAEQVKATNGTRGHALKAWHARNKDQKKKASD
jgi:hypothetical protein